MAAARAGTGGFGYDPVFVPEGRRRATMAELSDGEKDAISHRGSGRAGARGMAEHVDASTLRAPRRSRSSRTRR